MKDDTTRPPVEPTKAPPAKKNSEWVKFSTHVRARKDQITAVSANPKTLRIFLVGAQGILCMAEFASEEEFLAELESIDQQMG